MNVAVLGSGFIAPVFIENALKVEGYHIRCVWGRHIEKLEQFKDSCDYITTDLTQVLNDKQVDVVYIGLPNSLHYEYAKKALLANKHVLLEKPFCVTYQQAKELIDLSNEKDLLIYEAIMTLHSPSFIQMKKDIKLIGDIKIVDCNFSQFSRRYLKFKSGEILPAFDANLAGGALMDLGIYNIHFVSSLFGLPKKVKYYANVENEVDTSGILILDYGKFKASLICSKDSSSNAHVLIQGDNGTITCDSTSSRATNISLKTSDGIEKEYFKVENDEFTGMKYELKEFMDIFNKMNYHKCAKANKQTLRAMKILDKAY